MILKIYVDSKSYWVFYDQITELSVQSNKYGVSFGREYSDDFLFGCEQEAEVLLIIKCSNGIEKNILIPAGTAYLLNDEGKTIDKI